MFEFAVSLLIPLLLRWLEDDNKVLSIRNAFLYALQVFLVLYWIDNYFMVQMMPQIKEFIAGLTLFRG